MTITALAFVGCADHAAYDKNEKEDHAETIEQENEDSDQKKEEVQDESAESGAGSEIETETDSETEKENITDHYEPIPVSQMDHDSFQSRMTEEEHALFYRWDSKEVTDISHYAVGFYGEDNNEEMMIYEVRFDHGSWVEEKLAEAYRGEYFISKEAVDEDIFWQQIDAYETENVTGYEPEDCCSF